MKRNDKKGPMPEGTKAKLREASKRWMLKTGLGTRIGNARVQKARAARKVK